MNAKTRTRLSPEARRQQLLEVAREIIMADGLQGFSMERLAREAGVSSPLVYNYFSSRVETLRQLLATEYEAYGDKLMVEVERAEGFDEIVRVFVASNFDHYSPGNIIPILDSQPEIVEAIGAMRAEHGRRVARFLVLTTAESFRLTKAQAELAVTMSSGASIAAARYAAEHGGNRGRAINTAVAYILAGMRHIANEH